MASQTTPKGRVHLEEVTPHGEPDDSQGPCTPPKWLGVGEPPHGESGESGQGAPSATATSWDGSTDPSFVLLVLGNRLDRRNRGRFLLCHHEVVVVWPCPHALPSPALAASSLWGFRG